MPTPDEKYLSSEETPKDENDFPDNRSAASHSTSAGEQILPTCVVISDLSGSPIVAVVQPSDPGVRDYSSGSFRARLLGTAERRVLAEPEMRSVFVIVLDKSEEKATKMLVVRHDGVVE